MAVSHFVSRKRNLSCLVEENDNDERCEPISFSPNKKIKIDELSLVRKMFTDNDDFTKFNNIYQALLSIKSLLFYPNSILIQISIFATGNIKICDNCDETEILYLNKFNDEFLQNYRNGYHENSSKYFGWESGTSQYLYCKKCVDTNGLLLKCEGPCGIDNDGLYSKKHLNLAYGQKLNGNNIFICNECIEETGLFFVCNICSLWMYDAPSVDDKSVDYCTTCDEPICPCESYFYCNTEKEYLCTKCKPNHGKECECELEEYTNNDYYYPIAMSTEYM